MKQTSIDTVIVLIFGVLVTISNSTASGSIKTSSSQASQDSIVVDDSAPANTASSVTDSTSTNSVQVSQDSIVVYDSAPANTASSVPDSTSPHVSIADESGMNNNALYITLIVLAIATLISSSICFYLYRWRKVLLSRPELLVPEQWGQYLKSLGDRIDGLENFANSKLDLVVSTTDSNQKNINAIASTFSSLHDSLDEKDAEIRRHKEGYDSKVFKKYLLKFIKVNQYIGELIEDGDVDLNSVQNMKCSFEDALEECGVESFMPEIGEDYRRAVGVSDNPRSIATDKQEDDFKIAEIISAGYKLTGLEDDKIVLPAKVKIFIFKIKE